MTGGGICFLSEGKLTFHGALRAAVRGSWQKASLILLLRTTPALSLPPPPPPSLGGEAQKPSRGRRGGSGPTPGSPPGRQSRGGQRRGPTCVHPATPQEKPYLIFFFFFCFCLGRQGADFRRRASLSFQALLAANPAAPRRPPRKAARGAAEEGAFSQTKGRSPASPGYQRPGHRGESRAPFARLHVFDRWRGGEKIKPTSSVGRLLFEQTILLS